MSSEKNLRSASHATRQRALEERLREHADTMRAAERKAKDALTAAQNAHETAQQRDRESVEATARGLEEKLARAWRSTAAGILARWRKAPSRDVADELRVAFLELRADVSEQLGAEPWPPLLAFAVAAAMRDRFPAAEYLELTSSGHDAAPGAIASRMMRNVDSPLAFGDGLLELEREIEREAARSTPPAEGADRWVKMRRELHVLLAGALIDSTATRLAAEHHAKWNPARNQAAAGESGAAYSPRSFGTARHPGGKLPRAAGGSFVL